MFAAARQGPASASASASVTRNHCRPLLCPLEASLRGQTHAVESPGGKPCFPHRWSAGHKCSFPSQRLNSPFSPLWLKTLLFSKATLCHCVVPGWAAGLSPLTILHASPPLTKNVLCLSWDSQAGKMKQRHQTLCSVLGMGRPAAKSQGNGPSTGMQEPKGAEIHHWEHRGKGDSPGWRGWKPWGASAHQELDVVWVFWLGLGPREARRMIRGTAKAERAPRNHLEDAWVFVMR